MSNYILKNDKPVLAKDIMEWAKWYETADRNIEKTKVGKVNISTVFLGTDHSFGDGPPLLYETMIFGGELDQEQDRYTTKAEATIGHKRMVAKVIASEVFKND